MYIHSISSFAHGANTESCRFQKTFIQWYKYENTVLKQRHIDEILDATWGKKEEDNDNADNQNGTQSFSVVLISVPNQCKISVLKEIREITFLGLKEAKDIIESTPYVIKENISNSEARNIKNILERARAEFVIR